MLAAMPIASTLSSRQPRWIFWNTCRTRSYGSADAASAKLSRKTPTVRASPSSAARASGVSSAHFSSKPSHWYVSKKCSIWLLQRSHASGVPRSAGSAAARAATRAPASERAVRIFLQSSAPRNTRP